MVRLIRLGLLDAAAIIVATMHAQAADVTTRIPDRPHIEFIQSQVLAWKPTPWTETHPGTEIKILSIDRGHGDASTLVRYPAGWSKSGPYHLTVDEELFVLSGAIEINGRTYSEKFYAHLPAGYPRSAVSSKNGAVVLTFVSGEPHARGGTPSASVYDATRLVESIDTLNTPPSSELGRMGVDMSDPKTKGLTAAMFMLLREDPVTHEQTWLLFSRPYSKTGVEEIHPVVEELFLVEGEAAHDVGTMLPGAYFWRPPGLRHGPAGTKTGTVKFFRTKGGPLSTTFPDTGRKFTWTPPHQPILPPDLMGVGSHPPDTSRSY